MTKRPTFEPGLIPAAAAHYDHQYGEGSYDALPEKTQRRLVFSMAAAVQLLPGALGTHSAPPLDETDKGDLRLTVSSGYGLVRIDFGYPVAWVAMSKEDAEAFAKGLLQHADVTIAALIRGPVV